MFQFKYLYDERLTNAMRLCDSTAAQRAAPWKAGGGEDTPVRADEHQALRPPEGNLYTDVCGQPSFGTLVRRLASKCQHS